MLTLSLRTNAEDVSAPTNGVEGWTCEATVGWSKVSSRKGDLATFGRLVVEGDFDLVLWRMGRFGGLKGQEIELYDWSGHEIKLWKRKIFPLGLNSSRFNCRSGRLTIYFFNPTINKSLLLQWLGFHLFHSKSHWSTFEIISIRAKPMERGKSSNSAIRKDNAASRESQSKRFYLSC